MRTRYLMILGFVLFSFTFNSCKELSKESKNSEAVYVGEKDMAWAIAHYVEYPKEEMQFNRAGIVKVKFQVNEQGIVNEVEAILDEEIQAEIAIARKKLAEKEVLPINLPVISSLIRSVEKLQFEPARKDGKPINSTITTSVEFMLI
jgi:hypothetical protein